MTFMLKWGSSLLVYTTLQSVVELHVQYLDLFISQCIDDKLDKEINYLLEMSGNGVT